MKRDKKKKEIQSFQVYNHSKSSAFFSLFIPDSRSVSVTDGSIKYTQAGTRATFSHFRLQNERTKLPPRSFHVLLFSPPSEGRICPPLGHFLLNWRRISLFIPASNGFVARLICARK